MSKIDLEQVNKYEQIFIRTRQWGYITAHDVDENGIAEADSDPAFVIEFNGMLSRKRGVDENVRYFTIL